MSNTRPPYPPEFREQMVELVRSGRSSPGRSRTPTMMVGRISVASAAGLSARRRTSTRAPTGARTELACREIRRFRDQEEAGRGGSYPPQGGRPQGGGESGGRQRQMRECAGCGRRVLYRGGGYTYFEGTQSNSSRALRKSRKPLPARVRRRLYRLSHEQGRLPLFWHRGRAKVALRRMRGILACARFRVVGHTTTLEHCDAVGGGVHAIVGDGGYGPASVCVSPPGLAGGSSLSHCLGIDLILIVLR